MKINKRKFGNVMIIVSCMMTIIMFAAFVVGFFVDKEPTANLGSLDYVRGTLDDEGEFLESYKSIVTKNVIMCESLDDVVVKSEAKCFVAVHLYDEDGEYLGTPQSDGRYNTWTVDENTEIPVGGFRIVIKPHPIDGEYPELSLFDISKYANMVEVTYTK